jgi:hypothetical protein
MQAVPCEPQKERQIAGGTGDAGRFKQARCFCVASGVKGASRALQRACAGCLATSGNHNQTGCCEFLKHSRISVSEIHS